jgi:16S rRNA (cytosine967-C5)-methyltransferase
MPSDARHVALEVLRRTFEQGAYSDRAFQAAARDLSQRDRALAMRLAYGAVQRRATLDYLIECGAEP